ncbi:MAG: flagellar protein FlgN [Clostridia bacterium]|nr:flagellar protein FlgN [Clostridia bacterium]
MSRANILDPVLRSIAQAYQEQLVKYLAMERLAQEQRKAIEDRDIESLENIIKERQELIEAIEALNRKLRPLKEEIVEALGLESFTSKGILQEAPGIGAQELDQVLGRIGQILMGIKELDKNNEELLRAELNAVKSDLKEIQNKKQVNKAYGSLSKYQDSKFFDTNK